MASHVITTDSPITTFSGVDVRLITVGGTASVIVKKQHLYTVLYVFLFSLMKIQSYRAKAFPLCKN